MKNQKEILSIERLKVVRTGIDGGIGQLFFPAQREPMTVVWSFGGGWEHVSVSYRRRTPTWNEMCKVKEMFWNDEETVVQYHPKRASTRIFTNIACTYGENVVRTLNCRRESMCEVIE